MRPYCRWEAAGITAPQDRSLMLHDKSAYRQQEWFAMDLVSNFQYARGMVEAFRGPSAPSGSASSCSRRVGTCCRSEPGPEWNKAGVKLRREWW